MTIPIRTQGQAAARRARLRAAATLLPAAILALLAPAASAKESDWLLVETDPPGILVWLIDASLADDPMDADRFTIGNAPILLNAGWLMTKMGWPADVFAVAQRDTAGGVLVRKLNLKSDRSVLFRMQDEKLEKWTPYLGKPPWECKCPPPPPENVVASARSFADTLPEAISGPPVEAPAGAPTTKSVPTVVTLDETGKPVLAYVEKPADPELDRRALFAAARWTFTPALYGKDPVRFRHHFAVPVKAGG